MRTAIWSGMKKFFRLYKLYIVFAAYFIVNSPFLLFFMDVELWAE